MFLKIKIMILIASFFQLKTNKDGSYDKTKRLSSKSTLPSAKD